MAEKACVPPAQPVKQPSSRVQKASDRQASVGLLVGGVLFSIGLLCGVILLLTTYSSTVAVPLVLIMVLMGVVSATPQNSVQVEVQRDSTGKPKVFLLRLGGEVVTLVPGISWTHTDRYKWGARGLVGEPQTFHVYPDGAVEINGERIDLSDPQCREKLQREVCKHPVGTIARALTPKPATGSQADSAAPKKVQFKVKLDRFGHLAIEYVMGTEHEETGLRGIQALITNGIMRKPQEFHVDIMQRYVEIDHIKFDCTETGAKKLEQALNSKYVARDSGGQAATIEIKENRGANTGFDIRFMTYRAGMPFEIKEHLSAEALEVLCDHTRCDLLQPDVHLRLSAPYLLIRKRRHDMGEDKIPGFPDVNYLQMTALELQKIFNHPAVLKSGESAFQKAAEISLRPSQKIVELRVTRNPVNKNQLWVYSVRSDGSTGEGKALTHHNISELQSAGLFQPNLDICLSLDNARLSILNKETKEEEGISIDVESFDEELAKASSMLTEALRTGEGTVKEQISKPDDAIAKNPGTSSCECRDADTKPNRLASEDTKPLQANFISSAVQTALKPDPTIGTLFRETDPAHINREIFKALSALFEVEVQEAHFSLPRIFEDRRFEIISFYEGEIEDLMQLRGEDFCGFYLSHINDQKQVLVYACNGAHLEWGPDKCVLQHDSAAEAQDYPTNALLGLAQTMDEQLVFVVQRAFKEWVKPQENQYSDLMIHFCTVSDIAFAPDKYNLIWPEKQCAQKIARNASSNMSAHQV
jgi:hypothetical protein